MVRRVNVLQIGCVLASVMTVSCVRQGESVEKVQYVKTETVGVSEKERPLEYPGRVKASQEVGMSFQVAGKLKKIYVGDGESVTRGQLLAELDDRDYRLQLEAAEAEYTNVKVDAERVMRLYHENAVTASNYDKARYGLKQMESKYENCRNQLADTKIYAPFSGKVQKHYFDAPSVVGAGMRVLSVISGDSLEVEINVPAKDYLLVNGKCRYEAGFDFLNGRSVPLRYIAASPKANANQLYTIRLAIDSDKPAVAPGMNAIVKIYEKKSGGSVISVPSSSIFADNGKSCVWILSDGRVEKRQVELGAIRSDGMVAVLNGLALGEEVITAGVQKLIEGQRVKALPKVASSNVGGLL